LPPHRKFDSIITHSSSPDLHMIVGITTLWRFGTESSLSEGFKVQVSTVPR